MAEEVKKKQAEPEAPKIVPLFVALVERKPVVKDGMVVEKDGEVLEELVVSKTRSRVGRMVVDGVASLDGLSKKDLDFVFLDASRRRGAVVCTSDKSALATGSFVTVSGHETELFASKFPCLKITLGTTGSEMIDAYAKCDKNSCVAMDKGKPVFIKRSDLMKKESK